VALTALVLAQHGCASIQKPSWNKPVGRGTWIPALVCGAIGAGVGVAIQSQRPGTSRVVVDGVKRSVSDDPELWKGAVIGAPIGAAVCGLLGHVFLDPTPQVAFAPPPPTPAPTPPVVKKRIVLRGVHFDFDKSEIRPDAKPVLDRAVEILAENGDVDVVVEGHTDSIGTEKYNLALSVRRAEAVYRYLVGRGIAPVRLSVKGFGESRPVASNETPSGRAQNRRVALRVMP
jgi:outer membrane protein OmpA-like peptidoglycan-associated protein